MNETTIFKCDQEQALASWINYLNQIRLDQFIQDMGKQDQNLSEALKQLKWAELNINEVITRNRGGETGIHGFLAEILETGINNAQRLVRGKQANMTWLNDNGMIDLVRDGEGIQQKFYQSDGLFSLAAASRHLQQYPDFLKNGMKYQIPEDQYQKVIFLAHGCDAASPQPNRSGPAADNQHSIRSGCMGFPCSDGRSWPAPQESEFAAAPAAHPVPACSPRR